MTCLRRSLVSIGSAINCMITASSLGRKSPLSHRGVTHTSTTFPPFSDAHIPYLREKAHFALVPASSIASSPVICESIPRRRGTRPPSSRTFQSNALFPGDLFDHSYARNITRRKKPRWSPRMPASTPTICTRVGPRKIRSACADDLIDVRDLRVLVPHNESGEFLPLSS